VKSPQAKLFSEVEPEPDSCIIAAHEADERLRRQRQKKTAIGADYSHDLKRGKHLDTLPSRISKPLQGPYVADDSDLPEIFVSGRTVKP